MRFNPAFAASIGAIGALAVGVAAFAAMEPRAPRTKSQGPAVQISLVAPVEPEVGRGAVMEVGELIDGYQHRPVVQAVYAADEALPAYDYEERAARAVTYWSSDIEERRDVPRETAVVVRGGPMSFGFDQPRPDYAEERRLRREAMDRREHERREFRQGEIERRYERAAWDDRRVAPPPWRAASASAPDRLPSPPSAVDDTFY